MLKIKGFLLDIDNTLYAYEPVHINSINEVKQWTCKKINIENTIFDEAFIKAKKYIHIQLENTASSHNRLLYFQTVCEILHINPFNFAMKMYNLYWDTFLENIQLFDGVISFFECAKKQNIKICYVTDLTVHIQYRKIEKLGLSNYHHSIVTSEEAGIEKPDAKMFQLALNKLELKENEVVMIGDSYEKDIVSANNLGIHAIWLNQDNKIKPLIRDITEIKQFIEVLNFL